MRYDFNAQFNLYCAANEVGKTSLIKAIYHCFVGFTRAETKQNDNVEIVLFFSDDYCLRRTTYKGDNYQFIRAGGIIAEGKGIFNQIGLNSLVYQAALFLLNHEESELALAHNFASNWQEILLKILLPSELDKIDLVRADLLRQSKSLYTKHKFSKSQIALVEAEIKQSYTKLEQLKLAKAEQKLKFAHLQELKLETKDLEQQINILRKRINRDFITTLKVKIEANDAEISTLEDVIKQKNAKEQQLQIEINRLEQKPLFNSRFKFLLLLLGALAFLAYYYYSVYATGLIIAITAISTTYNYIYQKCKRSDNLMDLNLAYDTNKIAVNESAQELKGKQREKQKLMQELYQGFSNDYTAEQQFHLEQKQTKLVQMQAQIQRFEQDLNQLPSSEISEMTRSIENLKQKRKSLCFQYDKLIFMARVLDEIAHNCAWHQSPAFLKRANDLLSGLSIDDSSQIALAYGGKIILKRSGQKLEMNQLSTAMKNCLNIVLKIALLEFYDKNAELPLLIDDALISFDTERQSLMLKKIKQIAEHRQVIYVSKDRL